MLHLTDFVCDEFESFVLGKSACVCVWGENACWCFYLDAGLNVCGIRKRIVTDQSDFFFGRVRSTI